MILLKAESEALANWALERDQTALDTFLGGRGLGRVHDFSSVQQMMPMVVLAFVTWVQESDHRIAAVAEAIIADSGAHESATVLEGTIARLAANAAATVGVDPWNVRLAGGVPIINRAPLRDALFRRVSSGWRDVILVSGDTGTGRSHSWYLIEHVARATTTAAPLKIDVAKLTIEGVFDRLAAHLQVKAIAMRPTSTGATSATVAERYVAALFEALLQQPLARPVWLVFDSVDRSSLTPEIKEFLCHFTQRIIDHELANCTVFLLGATRDYGHVDPHQRAFEEKLSAFTPKEIRDAADSVNRQGNKPLQPNILDQRCAAMEATFQQGGAAAFANLALLLVALRDEVQA